MIYDELGFVPLDRGREFAINGRGLSKLVEVHGMVCSLGWGGRAQKQLVKALLRRGPSELPSGRVPLYVCERCGDLGCGALSVKVDEVDECIVWADLGYESFDDGFTPAQWFDERAERAFYFARDAYFAAIY